MSEITTFTPPHALNTAVLFLVFNRLDTTKQVFQAIRHAKPPRIYIAADGARESKEGEAEKIKAVRDYIMDNIDWECEIKTLFRDENLGCKYAVSGAITWFFENEEQGIILEDDCLPSQSFFWFCEELLDRYKDDLRVWHIAGNNFHFGWQRDKDYSCYFSYYGSIWGWASWANRWEAYDVEIDSYNEIRSKNYLVDVFCNSKEAAFRKSNFNSIKNGLDTWDFQWAYARFVNSGLSLVPSINMVKNLGFGEDATHTHSKSDKRSRMKNGDIKLPLKLPWFVIRDKVSDDRFFSHYLECKLRVARDIIKNIIRRVAS